MPFNDFIEVEIVEMLTTLVEDKDIYTGGHSKRVAIYASKIGEKIHLDKKEQEHLFYAGLLHDIGKVLTPDTVLLKPEKLKTAEFNIIKQHPVASEKIVRFLTPLKQYAKAIRHHHERYDGNGYPDGLKGEDIPLFSRILAFADAFDAMTTNRIYKHKKSIKKAIEEIKNQSGLQFDSILLPAAISVFESFTKTSDIKQTPQTNIDIERFAYFYKDSLTGAYSAKYLDYFLQENLNSKQFKCCYFIQVQHMHAYNKSFGWEVGDDTLREISLRIKALFHSSFIFRVFGDDFVVLNPLHVDMDKKVFYKLTAGFESLEMSISHFDLHKKEIKNWKSLERHLETSPLLAIQ
jgi:putative nucleotidyltransferase with HDIG domain